MEAKAFLVWIALGINGPLHQETPSVAHFYSHFETEAHCLRYAKNHAETFPKITVACTKAFVGKEVRDELIAHQKRVEKLFQERGFKVP